MAGLNGPHSLCPATAGGRYHQHVGQLVRPCRKEAASLERLSWSDAGSRYTVIGVSTDDDRNAALKWLRHSNATISHYIDSGPRWTLEHMLGASSIPVTVLSTQGAASLRGSAARVTGTPPNQSS